MSTGENESPMVDDENHIEHHSSGNESIQTDVATQGVKTNALSFHTEVSAVSEFRYGWFGWTPQWLQRPNKATWLLAVLCAFTVAQVKRLRDFSMSLPY